MPTKTTTQAAHFSPELFTYLRALKRNNDRDWFNDNKTRYETVLKEPALQFIRDFEGPLMQLSPYFVAIPKATGGSLFRIYRDTRFSKDKTPYKTQVGIHFRHERAKETPHSPGWYVHIEPKASFIGAGVWHGDGPTVKKIRDAIVDDPAGWKKAKKGWEIEGDVLKRPPRGYDAEHPLIDDIKHKDFVVSVTLKDDDVTAPRFLKTVQTQFKKMAPVQRFLTEAVGLPY